MTQYTGTPGNDTLTGSAAADFLDGGAGADSMSGLGGNDVYAVDDPGDVVIEAPGAGTDRVNSIISYSLPPEVEDLWLVGSATTSGTGNALDNVMWGNAAANVLNGQAGNDVIDGGAGADTLIGGTGNDTFWIDDAGDTIAENSGEGTDTVKSTLASTTLGANLENLELLAGAGNLQGIGNALNNVITGNEGNNPISGGGGDDSIDGGAGADTMAGGSGNDSFWVEDAGDSVIENSGEGTDSVTSSLPNYTLPANVENLTLGTFYGTTTPLNGTGNGLDNSLRGNSGSNVLSGGAGNDTLVGGDGNDTLTGGSGDDVFYFSTSDSGIDTITDLTSGDTIELCGTFFDGTITSGNGATVGAGSVQVATSGGQTILYIGLDATPGSDYQITLNGTHAAGNFHPRGFDLVYDTNHAPTLNGSPGNQLATEGQAFSFQLPAGTFTDIDGDALVLDASVIDPDWGILALPSWLSFDAQTGRLTGTPAHAKQGTVILMLTATDTHGATTDATFNLTVQPPQGPPPTVVITDDVSGVATTALTYTLSFSEPVTGLAVGDFTVTHGTVNSVSGSGSLYEVRVTPSVSYEGSMDLGLKAGAVTNAAGVPNLLSAAGAQWVDTRLPTVSLSSDRMSLARGETATLTLQLSEASPDLVAADLLVTGGTISSLIFSGNRATAIFEPALDGSTAATITLPSGRFSDAAGNFNADGSDSNNTIRLTLDTIAPSVSVITPSRDAGNVALDANLVVTFSEPIHRGTGAITLKTAAGAVIETFDATSTRLTLSGSTLTINPSANLTKGIAYTLDVDPGVVRDPAGNASAGIEGHRFEAIPNQLAGTASSERLIGCEGRDLITALGGDDTITAGAGDDRIDGGGGMDVSILAATRASAHIQATDGSFTVESAVDGRDTLQGVERLQFSDLNVALDLSGHAGTVARVIGALFGPQFIRDAGYVGIGLALADRDADCTGLVTMALGTEAFAHLAGSRSDADFVRLVFHNLTGAEPSPAQLDGYVGQLASGSHTQVSLAVLAAESETNALHIDLAGLALTGLDYTPYFGV